MEHSAFRNVDKLINRIIFIVLSALLFAFCSAVRAQQAKKVPRIGYLTLGSGPAEPEVAFKQRLRDYGWVEGQNIAIEFRWAANDTKQLASLAKELVDLKVDVIVASATPAIQAARNATATIPIVMAAAADPVASGFVGSLARPGGNITGLSLQSPELSGKRLDFSRKLYQNSPAWLSWLMEVTQPTNSFSGKPRTSPRESGYKFSRWQSKVQKSSR